MRGTITAAVLALTITQVQAADLSTKEANRIQEAATVLKEIHGVPDKDIPQELWDHAECVIVVPGLKKAAFVIGGEYGKGLMSCRHNGEWSAPIFMQIGKGSWGLQIGAQSIDLSVAALGPTAAPSILQLWPEHFDAALDVGTASGRCNVGISAGDSFCEEPYVYVGPWDDQRPGGDSVWNAPFGAFRSASTLPLGSGTVEAIRDFFDSTLGSLGDQ